MCRSGSSVHSRGGHVRSHSASFRLFHLPYPGKCIPRAGLSVCVSIAESGTVHKKLKMKRDDNVFVFMWLVNKGSEY